ncbi:RNA polymerase II mediator complex subunit [Malassezia obtusa]|uniref:Mediator of RNA polymerase II transcription subunit 12 n=1 Tax=Malassezia obtusa TaxID=76774 RepID=A0AAF0IXW5_9BASI|nr:RNA polymerase II mediator complex subunit [Malassezia obtusa]
MEPDGGLPAYALAAPAWRPPLHAAADLGWPGVRPPAPAELDAHALRHGATAPPAVANEGASAHEQIHARLARTPALTLLNALLDGVRDVRRRAHPHTIAPPSPAPPSRATLSDARLALYLRALADPGAPLAPLAHHIPHALRGRRLLEALWHGDGARAVPVPRAAWLVHAAGACDVRAGRTGAQATHACTADVLAWLTESLAACASTPAWAAAWAYRTALAHALRAARLVDTHAYLAWLVAQLAETHAAPARVCVLQLVDDALPLLVARAALARALVAALAPRTDDVPFVAAHAAAVRERAVSLAPDAAVGVADLVAVPAEVHARTHAVRAALAPLLTEAEGGAHGAVGASDAACTPGAVGADAAAVRALDAGTLAVPELFLRLFRPAGAPVDLGRRLALVLAWACTEAHDAPGRAYVAAALLHRVHLCQAGRLVLDDGRRVACVWAPVPLFDAVARWIDDVDAHPRTPGVSTAALARLLGALARVGLFSYARFAQRLSARGILRHQHDAPRTLRHRAGLHARLFRTMPVEHASDAVRALRRSAIYGARTAESYEETTERRATRELARACAAGADGRAGALEAPWPAPPGAAPAALPPAPATSVGDALALPARLPHLLVASPYIQTRVVAHILPRVLDDTRGPSADAFALLATVLTTLGAFPALAQLCVALLDRHVETRCVVCVARTVAAHARVFAALERRDALAERLAPYAVHDASASVGQRIVPAQGRTMAVAAARAALAALALEPPPPPLPEARAPSAEALAAAAAPAAALLRGDALDAASDALLAAVPLADAPGALWTHLLAALCAPHAAPPTPAVVACVAALAGAAGVRLPVAAWMRDTYALHGGTPRAASSAWCALVAGLVALGHVDADEVLRVLCAYAPRATPHDAFYTPCVTLSNALVCTTSVPGAPCSLPVLGAAAWYDLGLLRTHLARAHGLVPWLAAARAAHAAPALGAALAPHHAGTRTRTRSHAAWPPLRRATLLALVRALDPEIAADAPPDAPPDAPAISRAVSCATPWTAGAALAALHTALRATPPDALAPLAHTLVATLLPPPAAADALFDQLRTLGMPPALPAALADAALDRWLAGEREMAHALARLAPHVRGYACGRAPEALRAVTAALARDADAWAAAHADADETQGVRDGHSSASPASPASPQTSPLASSPLPTLARAVPSPERPPPRAASPPGGVPRYLLHHLAVLLFLVATHVPADAAPRHAEPDVGAAAAADPLLGALTPLLALACTAHAAHTTVGEGFALPHWVLLADCAVAVQSAARPAALAAWLRGAPAVPHALARLVRYDEPRGAHEPWTQLEAVGAPPPPASRDPWAVPLSNDASVPLEAVHARKTRDAVPHTTMRAAPPPWLTHIAH